MKSFKKCFKVISMFQEEEEEEEEEEEDEQITSTQTAISKLHNLTSDDGITIN